MHTMTRMQQVLLAVGSIFLMGACASRCGLNPPTITCRVATGTVTVQPGECTAITNPCLGIERGWLASPEVDDFQLCSPPAGISVRTSRGEGLPTTRKICADADVATTWLGGTVEYQYTIADAFGEGTISVDMDTGNPIRFAPSATPATINFGESSQLLAVPLGGIPPYTFDWVPAGSLEGADTLNPIATPASTTTYVVTVTDSRDVQVNAGSVTVTVNPIVSASATPPSINSSQTSQLAASVQGGALPYSYAWSPASSLNDPASANPIASPGATTTYTVVVNDGAGGNASASTTVTVTDGDPTACFTYTNNTVFQVIDLNASCSTGGVVRYEWDFSFEPGNPDIVGTTPFAFREYGFGSTGTITLTVFDAGGASSSTSLPFP